MLSLEVEVGLGDKSDGGDTLGASQDYRCFISLPVQFLLVDVCFITIWITHTIEYILLIMFLNFKKMSNLDDLALAY